MAKIIMKSVENMKNFRSWRNRFILGGVGVDGQGTSDWTSDVSVW